MSYKGFQIAYFISQLQLNEVMSNKPSLLRVQFLPETHTIEAWKQSSLIQIQEVKSKIYDYIMASGFIKPTFVLDCHRVPNTELNTRVELLKWFWKELHQVFLGCRNVVYDILNEPAGTSLEVKHIMDSLAIYLRSLGVANTIVISPPYCDPLKFDSTLFLGNENYWYKAHFYLPFSFSHQGIYGRPSGKKYPTLRNNSYTMKNNLKKLSTFKSRNNCQLYIGEFSASIYAVDEYRSKYLKECILQFNRLNAHWTYHAMYESHEWALPLGSLSRQTIMNNVCK